MSTEPSASSNSATPHDPWAQAIFEQAPVAMLVLRGTSPRTLRVEHANTRAREILGGVGAADISDRAVVDVVPNLAPDFAALLARVMSTGEGGSIARVYQPQDRDGDGVPEDYWFNGRVRPLHTPEGVVDGVVVVFVDVSDMVHALHASEAMSDRLRESEQNARILFRDAPLPMWVYDRTSLRVLDVNAAALETYGYTRDEFLTLTLRDLRSPEDMELLETTLRTISSTEDVWHLRVRHVTRTGRHLQVDLTTQYITYNGQPARIALAQDLSAEQAALEALQRSDERYALAARATNHAIWDLDTRRNTLTWSEGITTLFGYDASGELSSLEGWLENIHSDDRARVAQRLRDARARTNDAAASSSAWEESYRFRRRDGTWADVLDRGSIGRDADGDVVRIIGAMEDVTAQRQLEARLRQAQKMEAIGQLAGGIAHDFNNLLTVIGGSLEFARGDLGTDHPVRPDLEEIAAATERARTLVRQLLTFSRQQPVTPRIVQVGEVVRGMERLLRRVIGEEIVLHVLIDAGKPPVLIDPGQLEQVLMNLAVNARDAMLTPRFGHSGTGGSLTIEVASVVINARTTGVGASAEPGRYVQLTVRDTGHGMDADTQLHLFEPFFTTKDVGSGTGLGLATVHGIVRQNGGTIHVDSAPGLGATFTILLPAAEPPNTRTTPREGLRVVPATPATILVVEDEAPVRAIVRRTLERHGLQVLEARHGVDALLLWKRHRDVIRVVLTDVRMPEMGGQELATALRQDRPTLPVVFVSGYADSELTRALGPHDRFVEKPFTTDILLAALVEALHDSASALN